MIGVLMTNEELRQAIVATLGEIRNHTFDTREALRSHLESLLAVELQRATALTKEES